MNWLKLSMSLGEEGKFGSLSLRLFLLLFQKIKISTHSQISV
jgi:hypothetical protein